MSDTKVLYNDACPICRKEIQHYAKLSAVADLPILFDDLGNEAQLAQWGLSAQQAAKRLHVRKDGTVYAGIPAFIVLWREIPQYRWLAKLVSLPVVHGFSCLVYDHILAPVLYRWHLRRQRRAVVCEK